MKKLLVIVLALLSLKSTLSQNLLLSDTDYCYVPSAKIVCGPWLQAVGLNEFTVMWTTNVESAVWVEVAPDDSSHFYSIERPKFFQVEYGRRPVGTLHKVRVSGLKPGTYYRYRIFQQPVVLNNGNRRMVFGDATGSEVNKKDAYSVTTLDTTLCELNIAIVNDIHGKASLLKKLMKGVNHKNTDFVVFNGDMVTQIESEQQIIDGYLSVASETFASVIPLFALRGNHEYRGVHSYQFFRYFPNCNSNAYYAFRAGPAFFVFLDCGEDKPDSDVRFYGLSQTDKLREEEAVWLQKVVNSKEYKNSPIRIVFLHMPPFLRGWHGTKEIERLFVPILNNAAVTLMVSGHLHRHCFIEKGAKNNNFPVLVNSNDMKANLSVTSKDVEIELVDESGNTVNAYRVTSLK